MTKNPTTASDNEVIERDWQIFSSLDRLTNHWDRPGWDSGQRAYYWYVIFDESDELRKLSARCQSHLPATTFNRVPLDDLHMTIDRLGPENSYEPAQISAIGDAARKLLGETREIDLNVGPLAGSAGAIRFSVTPHEPLLRVRDLLREATITCVSGVEFETDEFRPHVGIAYSNSQASAYPTIRTIEPLRSIPGVAVKVTEVSLVLLERRTRTWAWTIAEQVPLARAARG